MRLYNKPKQTFTPVTAATDGFTFPGRYMHPWIGEGNGGYDFSVEQAEYIDNVLGQMISVMRKSAKILLKSGLPIIPIDKDFAYSMSWSGRWVCVTYDHNGIARAYLTIDGAVTESELDQIADSAAEVVFSELNRIWPNAEQLFTFDNWYREWADCQTIYLEYHGEADPEYQALPKWTPPPEVDEPSAPRSSEGLTNTRQHRYCLRRIEDYYGPEFGLRPDQYAEAVDAWIKILKYEDNTLYDLIDYWGADEDTLAEAYDAGELDDESYEALRSYEYPEGYAEEAIRSIQ